MTEIDRNCFCGKSINCLYFRDFCSDIKTFFSDCLKSTKKCNICAYFSCLTNKDFFVDLEKGVDNKQRVFNKEPGNKNDVSICVNCSVNKADVVILPCGHGTFCNDCLEEWSETNNNCPTCGITMTDVVQCI